MDPLHGIIMQKALFAQSIAQIRVTTVQHSYMYDIHKRVMVWQKKSISGERNQASSQVIIEIPYLLNN